MIIQLLEDRVLWEQLLDETEHQSFLQRWSWGEFHRSNGYTVLRFGIFENNVLVAAAQTIITTARRGSFLLVPHGPVFKSGVNTKEVMAILLPALKKAAQEYHCHFIRVCPLLLSTQENEHLFTELGFRQSPIHVHPELSWILDVRPNLETLLSGMRKTTRYSIRKAEKDGVQVEHSVRANDVDRFLAVYKTTVERQHFTPFSRNYLLTEFETFQNDGNAMWFFAQYQGELVSAAMIIFDAHSAYYHHGASTHRFPLLTASHLLQWHVIQEAKRRGLTSYNFWGIAPEDQKKHPWAGLSLFKRGFGGSPQQYVHAKDYIISPRYYLAYAIERIRKFRRGL